MASPALNFDLLTKPPGRSGIGGGAASAILGSIQMVGLATIIAVPIGMLGGVYVNEFSTAGPRGSIRFAADVLVGVPSILDRDLRLHVPRAAVQAVQRIRRERSRSRSS